MLLQGVKIFREISYADTLRYRILECFRLKYLAQQAIQLDGVGAKMAALIGNMVQKKNAEFLENPDSNSQISIG